MRFFALFSDIKFNFSEIIENSLSGKILAWCYLVISDFTFSYILTGGIRALVNLLKVGSEEMQSVAVSVLCNISEHDPIRRALTEADAGPILIKLLSSASDDIQSRAAIVVSDLACVDNNQCCKFILIYNKVCRLYCISIFLKGCSLSLFSSSFQC